MAHHPPSPLAHPIPVAAAIAGVSVRSLRAAIERGELTPRYPTSRPVILRTDLERWVATAPTTRNARTGRPS